MNSRVEPQVVHESEAQRQHVRVRIPAVLNISDSGSGSARHKVRDLSVAGLAFDCDGIAYREAQRLVGMVSIKLDGIMVSIPVQLYVRRVGDQYAYGEFDDLEANAIASLREMISAYLAGEVVHAGDVLSTLNRNNFTAPRKGKAGAAPASRPGAFVGTAASFLIGAVALGFVGSKLYDLLFVTSSSVAAVQGASYPVTMPREGTFRSLVAEGSTVEKGAPLGTFETPMLEIVRSEALAANLSAERLNSLLEDSVKGTVTSPCTCLVQRQLAGDGQFVGKGQSVFELIDVEREPVVVARFGYKRLGDLKPGRKVLVSVAGSSDYLSGEILRVAHAQGVASSDAILEVIVKPDHPLAPDLINRPAEVSMMTPSFMPNLHHIKFDSIPAIKVAERPGQVQVERAQGSLASGTPAPIEAAAVSDAAVAPSADSGSE